MRCRLRRRRVEWFEAELWSSSRLFWLAGNSVGVDDYYSGFSRGLREVSFLVRVVLFAEEDAIGNISTLKLEDDSTPSQSAKLLGRKASDFEATGPAMNISDSSLTALRCLPF